MKRNNRYTLMIALLLLVLILPGCLQNTTWDSVNQPSEQPSVTVDGQNTSEAVPSDIPAPTTFISSDAAGTDDNGEPVPVLFIENDQDIQCSNTWDVSLVDVNGDLFPDAYFEFSLWMNDGKGTFTKTDRSFGSKDAWFADFNGDHFQDAVCENVVYFNDGEGEFKETVEIPSDFEMPYAKPVDIDNDGDIDIISADQDSDRIFINDGTGEFADSGIVPGGWSQCRYAVGDINADNFNDIYVAIPHTSPPNMRNTKDRIWLGSGSGLFTEKSNDIPDGESRDVIMSDFNGDGSPDLFIADGLASARLLFNDGSGNFTNSDQKINTGFHAAAAKTADFNNDGSLDIIVANGKPLDNGQPNTVWLNDGNGNFTDSNLALGSSNSMQLALSDLDCDGDIDALIVNVNLTSGSAPVEVWLNGGNPISYLDSAVPGDTPMVFARGNISLDGVNTHTLSFSPTGRQLIFSRYPQAKSYMMEFSGQTWCEPTDAPFSGMEACYSQDGKRIFYYMGSDLYYVERNQNQWGHPAKLDDPINTGDAEIYPCVTLNGTLYFSRNGNWDRSRLMVSRLEYGKYSTPEDLGSPINDGGALHAYIAPDESYMIFNSHREGSYTELDLWISFMDENGSWEIPKNLGEAINAGTKANLCPKVSPDGKYLFYTKLDEDNTGLVYWVRTNFLESLKD